MDDLFNRHQLELFIQAGPKTVNHTQKSSKSGRRYKTKETRDWENDIKRQLRYYRHEVKAFRESFNERSQALEVSYIWYMRPEKLFTKTKKISRISGDTDNFIKPIQDIICDVLRIDDAYIYSYMSIKKVPHVEDKIFFGANIVDMVDIPEYRPFLAKDGA